MLGSFFYKVAFFVKKETPTQVFSFKICEIFKNTFFSRTLQWLLLWGFFSLLLIKMKHSLIIQIFFTCCRSSSSSIVDIKQGKIQMFFILCNFPALNSWVNLILVVIRLLSCTRKISQISRSSNFTHNSMHSTLVSENKKTKFCFNNAFSKCEQMHFFSKCE